MQILETERLIVRTLSHSDLPSLAAILSDPEVMEYSVRGVCDEAMTRKFIDWCLACYVSHGVGPWALIEKHSLDLIGFCGVGPEMVGGVEEISLGYRLAKRYWSKGLATEAVRVVLDYAFFRKQFDSVVVIIEPKHVSSLKVAEKAGFRNFDELEFHGRSVRLYRLAREYWSALRNHENCTSSA